MKKIRFSIAVTALALMLPSAVMGAETIEPCVVVEQTDGTRTEYLLSAEPRVSYDGAVVRLVSSTASVELAVADVAKVYLAESTTGISSPAVSPAVRIRLTATGLQLCGLEPGSTVSVCILDGRQLCSGRATSDGSLTLPLNNHVPGGVIVVRTSKQSFKLTRK